MIDQSLPPAPLGQTPKKKMSKGCLVILSVVGVFILLILTAIVLAFIYKEEMAKYFTQNIIEGSKTALVLEGESGIDSVYYNRIADGFVEKLTASEIEFGKYQAFFVEIQNTANDGKLDSAEAEMMIRAMIAYFPELSEISRSVGDTVSTVTDSLQTED